MIQRIVEPVSTPTITSGSAYASGNAVGGLLTFSIPGMSDEMTITKVVVTDKSGQKAPLDLLIFNQLFTPTADKSAEAISSADLVNMEGALSILASNYVTVGTGAVATYVFTGGGLDVISKDLNTKLYGQLVCRGTPTYVSTSDLQVTLGLEVWRE